MSKEEKKAIDKITKQIVIGKCSKNIGIPVYISDLEIVLNLIEKQQEQLQEKDKIIDAMAKLIDLFKNKMDMLRNFEEDCFIPREFSDIDDCVKRKECKDCVIEYFTKKAREV